MRVDGRMIAAELVSDLKQEVEAMKRKGITPPHLAVFLIGNDPASQAYVNQKKKKGEEIGMIVTVHTFSESVSEGRLLQEIHTLNNNPQVHGIIIQQPLPDHIAEEKLIAATDPKKDVDGFHPESKFTPPIAEAAVRVLHYISVVASEVSPKADEAKQSLPAGRQVNEIVKGFSNPCDDNNFITWLRNETIVVVGKGETGGAPIIKKLQSLDINPSVIDSKTIDPKSILLHSDIVISCVGKEGILTPDMLKNGVILLGIGMHRGNDGKLHGDYNEEEIKNIANYYTPIPGGIGPVNVAMLLKNVINAAETM